MKSNVWEYAEAFNEMTGIYDNLGVEDNWLETLAQYDGFMIGQKKVS